MFLKVIYDFFSIVIIKGFIAYVDFWWLLKY